jgi:hypothetical protein
LIDKRTAKSRANSKKALSFTDDGDGDVTGEQIATNDSEEHDEDEDEDEDEGTKSSKGKLNAVESDEEEAKDSTPDRVTVYRHDGGIRELVEKVSTSTLVNALIKVC